MFRKIKARFALGAITAIMAITGAAAGSAADTAQTAVVKTASITDVASGLRSGVQKYTIINAWPKKSVG